MTDARGVKKFLLFPIGILCLTVGAVGMVLPILPGWPFLFIGLTILAPRQAVRLRRWTREKFFRHEAFRMKEWQKLDVSAGFTTKHFPFLLKKTDDWLDLTHQKQFKELLWKFDVLVSRDKAGAGRFAFLDQVHGSNVAVLDDSKILKDGEFHHCVKADGVLTNIPRLTLLALSADCLSIFLCAVKKERGKPAAQWVGLLHAGWRGTKEGIARKGVALLAERAGVQPGDIYAAFGPCISADHYEVGEEFAGHFPAGNLQRRDGKLFFDLSGENRRQLLEAGVSGKRILDQQICTFAQNRHFPSFRVEKDGAGRIASFITKL